MLQTERLQTLEEIRTVLDGNQRVDFKLADRASAYDFIRRTLVRFHYRAWASRTGASSGVTWPR